MDVLADGAAAALSYRTNPHHMLPENSTGPMSGVANRLSRAANMRKRMLQGDFSDLER